MKVTKGNYQDFFEGIESKFASARIPRLPVECTICLVIGGRVTFREAENEDEKSRANDTYQILLQNEKGEKFAQSFGTLPTNVQTALLALKGSERKSFFDGKHKMVLSAIKSEDAFILDSEGNKTVNSQNEVITFTRILECNVSSYDDFTEKLNGQPNPFAALIMQEA